MPKRISNQEEFYLKIADIHAKVGIIDANVENVKGNLQKLEGITTSNTNRIEELEKITAISGVKIWLLFGAGAGVAGIIMAIITSVLQKSLLGG